MCYRGLGISTIASFGVLGALLVGALRGAIPVTPGSSGYHVISAVAQQLPTDEAAPLVLVRIIPIPGVVGRFDHMAVDNSGGRVFAAVYGNDSVEVIDTARGRQERSLKEGFVKPQMVASCRT